MNTNLQLQRAFSLFLVLGIASSIQGCSSIDSVQEPSATAKSRVIAGSVVSLRKVSSIREVRGANTLLQNEPATSNVEQLRAACAAGASIGELALGVYELESVTNPNDRISSRAVELEMDREQGAVASVSAREEAPWAVMRNGSKRLKLNAFSGDEVYTDVELFHRGPGAKSALSDDEAVQRAAAHIRFLASKGQGLAVDKLYPYRIRRYMNSTGDLNGTVDKSVYQTAVAYNDSIDDFPVIGPGGKIAVHLTVNGQVAAHESNLRRTTRKLRSLAPADMVCPDTAQGQVEDRLKALGKNLSHFALARTEFGYLRLGRNSIQRVVAPHYAFFYRPLPGVMSKAFVETIPATRDPETLELIARDGQAEADRKAAHRANSLFNSGR